MDKLQGCGAFLMGLGVSLSLISYWLLSSVPLTALGVGSVIVGASLLSTPPNPLPKPSLKLMLEGSIVNLEALLEEFDVKAKGYYVPRGDEVYVYVPLKEGVGPPKGYDPPRGLFVEEGGGPYLVLVSPSSYIAKLVSSTDLELAIAEALVDLCELVRSVRVALVGDVMLEVKDPSVSLGNAGFEKVLGSLEASTAATLAAKLLGRPVRVASEEVRKGGKVIRLEVF